MSYSDEPYKNIRRSQIKLPNIPSGDATSIKVLEVFKISFIVLCNESLNSSMLTSEKL